MTTVPLPRVGMSLTAREVEVLQLIAAGEPNARIGMKLGITEHTVKRHVVRVGCKLGAPTRAGMVRAGFEQGVLRLPDAVVLRQASEVAQRRLAAQRLAERRSGRAA